MAILHLTGSAEAEGSGIAEDDVVQHLDADVFAGLHQAFGDC